ncbi:MAG: hypothetical protein HYR74_06830 [Candidatus Eisenbacteria bacterium]|nr:hypothetical protein [Candidatus Eisenbacteria bacterium]
MLGRRVLPQPRRVRERVLGEGEHRIQIEVRDRGAFEVHLGRGDLLPYPVTLTLVVGRIQHPVGEQIGEPVKLCTVRRDPLLEPRSVTSGD